jgi:hypothetical protein
MFVPLLFSRSYFTLVDVSRKDRLVAYAFYVLEEAAAAARQRPVRRTWGIRLALTFLASVERHAERPPRWPFETFWRHLGTQRPRDRAANLNAALNAIYVHVGVQRDLGKLSRFERIARNAQS